MKMLNLTTLVAGLCYPGSQALASEKPPKGIAHADRRLIELEPGKAPPPAWSRWIARMDAWYPQPDADGRQFQNISKDLTFKTSTRNWMTLRADLVERGTGKVVASYEYKQGATRPTRDQE